MLSSLLHSAQPDEGVCRCSSTGVPAPPTAAISPSHIAEGWRGSEFAELTLPCLVFWGVFMFFLLLNIVATIVVSLQYQRERSMTQR